ncbi:membrane protein [Arenimonas donghaensis]|uniref:Lipid A biosynthesis N-terminal domain-containing protein n=1 Tax=Arenimonas donghaensis DSM 18148 = HO3-R19 TaxID=1121014 RepID=A0A087MK72_9GAMM|nr:membrane protein [Arenimonas donghaensis]KFL37275.1 hypothetical protein N788_10570 [Arenimonas donghaensis DSM 18148 = HO3-R19]
MQPADYLGWAASGVLLLTLGRQVWVQWREARTEGLSSWLFLGQMTASAGFVVYSVLVGNAVFVLTNAALLATAIAGQCIYRRNLRREAKGRARSRNA